jgi:tRNA G26 N,N-dimethylase Trm1
MKQAIGTFNGWRCPTCKRLVAKPLIVSPVSTVHGKCKFCGEELVFKEDRWSPPVHDFAKTDKMVKEHIKTLHPEEGVDIPVKILKRLDDIGRVVMISFLNRPTLLKTLEKYGKEKELFLSEVVVGFAAKGFKVYLEEKGLIKNEK